MSVVKIIFGSLDLDRANLLTDISAMESVVYTVHGGRSCTCV